MRTTIDLTPLFRPVVDLSLVRDVIDAVGGGDGPPCTIRKIDSGAYRLQFALGGFRADEIEVRTIPNIVIVAGIPMLDKARRRIRPSLSAFERRFEVPNYVAVKSAIFRKGVLEIELRREFPASQRVSRVEIEEDDGFEPKSRFGIDCGLPIPVAA